MSETFLSRTQLLLGEDAVQKFQQSCVMVVGCGAVGGFAVEALVRAGIGSLILVDFDVVKPSNANRQLAATQETLGLKKTHVLARHAKQINSDIQIKILDMLVNDETIDILLAHSTDYIIDAIDSLNSKTLLIEKLVKRNRPFISSMGAALRTDPSKIQIVPLKKTIECPLAAFLRKRLRRRGVSLNFPVVYSSEHLTSTIGLGEMAENDLPGGRNRHTLGSLSTIPGIFGLLCAHYVLMALKNQPPQNSTTNTIISAEG